MIEDKIVKKLLRINFYIIMLIVLLPIFILIAFSFNNASFPGFPWSGFTFKWYGKLFLDSLMIRAIRNSIIVGFFTALLSTFIGFVGAMAFYKAKSRFAKTFNYISFLPPLIPFVLSGIAFITFLRYFPVSKSLITIVLFQSAIFFPIALGIIGLRLGQINPLYFDATRNLGGSYYNFLRKVLLPLMKTTLFGVLLLIFALSWDEFIISWFVAGFEQTIPIRIWTLLKSSIDPSINALGTISFLISFIMLIIAQRLLFKNEGYDNAK